MKLIIDLDLIAYRSGFAAERTKYIVTEDMRVVSLVDNAKDANETGKAGPGGRKVWSRKELEPEETALLICDSLVNDIKARYADQQPSVLGFLTGIGNFRHSVATRASYKGNRSGSVPPSHLRAIRTHLKNSHGAIESAGEEADDLLGKAMTAFPGSVCCSTDKDLMQLPGRHYNFVLKEEYLVSAKDAVLNFYGQVLSGDATDQIPGLTGIGPVKAAAALEKCTSPAECWRIALDMYTAEFGTRLGPKYALECAQLVYVRRKEGEIWAPPTELQKSASGATSGKKKVAGSGRRAASGMAGTVA